MEDVRYIYEKWAKQYDKDAKWNLAIQMEKGIIIPILNPNKKDTILEIGCGTGRLTIPVSRMCKRITGVDFSEYMLETAKMKSTNYKNIRYRKMDATKRLQFKDSSFDKVICPLLINHITNLNRFFQEVRRVLKKGGIFVFDDCLPDGTFRVSHRSVLDKEFDKGHKVFSDSSIDDYVHYLHRSNFDIQEVKFLRFDQKIRGTITYKSYKKNKGHTLGLIIKAQKL